MISCTSSSPSFALNSSKDQQLPPALHQLRRHEILQLKLLPHQVSVHSFALRTQIARPRRRICTSAESFSSVVEDEWLQKLPDKKKPLYSHSLPGIEAWLQSLGFFQSKEDRAVWRIERPDWHAQLSLDVTDLFVRYLKSGPGNLERDVERKFSYALSREDLENAILGGP